VELPEVLLALVVRICVEAAVDGLRPDLTIYRAACALAALDGRACVVEDDVYRAALLALPHRRRPHPLDPPPGGTPPPSLEQIIAQHQANTAQPDESSRPGRTGNAPDEPADADHGPAAPDRLVAAAAPIPLRLPDQPRKPRPSGGNARRGVTGQGDGRGRVIGARRWDRRSSDIAPLASLLAAALATSSQPPRLTLAPRTLRQRRRRGSARRFILFVVDCSGSMGARDRMAVTKAAVLALLGDAYRARDQVALLGFRDTGALLLIKPTRDVVQAMAHLQSLPTGGRTPLGAALLEASAVARRERARTEAAQTRVVLITDGRTDQADLERGIVALSAECDDIVVVDSEDGFVRLGRARGLASKLRARYIRLVA
jgi:magnesium chelatase subunit D